MKYILGVILVLFFAGSSVAQNQDTTARLITTKNQSNVFDTDSLGKDETYSLDIGKNRGLFILTPDQKMQLRIMGSIRFRVHYDFVNYPINSTFNPYHIPMGDDKLIVPNYYGDLNQSRFGFEVTRALNTGKSVFMRLEMGFSGPGKSFRIRHAYGQYKRLLVGQTWSLFTNVSALPTTVNFDGPVGSVFKWSPQIRYFGANKKGTRWAVALEYSRIDYNQEEFDENNIVTVQMIPDATARFEQEGSWGAVQLSGVVTTLSVVEGNNRVNNKVGYGGSLSGFFKKDKNKLLYQAVYGKSISHYVTTFGGTGSDVIFNPMNNDIESLFTFAGCLAYEYSYSDKITATISCGYANLANKSFQADTDFSECMSAAIDAFWIIADGTRIGCEYMYGQRWNISGESSGTGRVGAIFYYDF